MVLKPYFFVVTAVAASATIKSSRPCVDFQAIVSVQANNTIYDVPRVDSNIDAVDFVWNITAWTSPNLTQREIAPRTVDETFSISARLCVPPGGAKADILQIATHGFGFDKRYWDPTIRTDTNSYVNDVLKAGYSILIYDRLGVGQSDTPDAYEINQAPVQVEVINQLNLQARSGHLVPINAAKDLKIPQFKKVVLVGHSLGTRLAGGALAKYGADFDGAILTGSFPNAELIASNIDSFGFEYAPESDHSRFGRYGSGTLVQATRSSVQQLFMKKGDFEPDLLAYAEQVKQPAAIGELVSTPKVWPLPAPEFTGPVLIVTAEYDFFGCRGVCDGLLNLPYLATFYPKASNVSSYIQQRSGHGQTLHKNAADTSRAIFSYLGQHGL